MGGGHGLNCCRDPCDQNCIAQNKAKFEDEKNHTSGGGCTGGGHPCCGRHNQGQGNYEQNNIGVANTALHSVIQCPDGVWMAYLASDRP